MLRTVPSTNCHTVHGPQRPRPTPYFTYRRVNSIRDSRLGHCTALQNRSLYALSVTPNDVDALGYPAIVSKVGRGALP